ncbi:CoA transferase [Methylobacterium sp. J-030]|uniref:CaiB/BaiF CoA transferase family protein n=1 Tax=Methylobacterium sp. J-030 TaxID=2836627 RepID=UPI001FBB7E51|nr:CoA transferase [Methylobacterium sp. J-030]MCJ2072428.1 CoA transferase [Methylobacterium sp. J-030]
MDDAGHVAILEGVRVLDLTRFLSGPQATLFLAGLGAEVIRIDEPAGDPTAAAPPLLGPLGVSLERQTPGDIGIAYLKRSRGKKAITLNLKAPEGRELLMRLVEGADVLVENFRVGVTERLGIAWDALRERNPRLVHCRITGYGATGPDAPYKAFDLMVQAACGIMSITGSPDSPPSKTGSSLSDGIAGTFALSGILGALLQRERTGCGQSIDVSMVDCLVSLMMDEPFDVYHRLGLDLRQGNRIARFSPFNTYPTLDGTVALGAATPRDWVALLEVMRREDLLTSPQFMSIAWRLANNAVVDSLVSAFTTGLTSAALLGRLNERDIPCSAVRSIDSLAAWPHLRHREMLMPLRHPECDVGDDVLAPGFPIKFSAAAVGYGGAPAIAEHNAEILGHGLGLRADELDDLRRRGVI